uniref:Uncharacterized protein n=1 Tax=Lygus hesperus TaxID=30085 RepID=A0A146LV98_LYGHE
MDHFIASRSHVKLILFDSLTHFYGTTSDTCFTRNDLLEACAILRAMLVEHPDTVVIFTNRCANVFHSGAGSKYPTHIYPHTYLTESCEVRVPLCGDIFASRVNTR